MAYEEIVTMSDEELIFENDTSKKHIKNSLNIFKKIVNSSKITTFLTVQKKIWIK